MTEPIIYDFDYFQQLYALSTASNVVGNSIGTSAQLGEAMYNALNKHLYQLAGEWKLKWGPAIYKSDPTNPDTGPDNAWFVAVSDKWQTCTVAIAGTAVTSVNDILGDLDVDNVVDFGSWSNSWTPTSVSLPETTTFQPGDDRILCSLGTCQFVHNVLQQVELWNGTTATPLGKFLRDFHNTHRTYKIVFAGHSLGGGLVPALALGLCSSGKILHQSGDIKVLASAGPSIGNQHFADAFTKLCPPETDHPGFHNFNNNLFNTRDVVPQAFMTLPDEERTLYNICFRIYIDQSNAGGNTVKDVWDALYLGIYLPLTYDAYEGLGVPISEAGAGYKPLAGLPFTGPKIPLITGVPELYQSVLDQHTLYYWNHIGIPAWVKDFTATVQAAPGVQPIKPKTALSFELPKEGTPAYKLWMVLKAKEKEGAKTETKSDTKVTVHEAKVDAY